MKVKNYLETKPEQEVPGVALHAVITAEDGAPNFAMRVIEVEPGSSTPFHFHPWEHEAFIISGRGILKSEQGETPLAPDSVVYIAPNEKHCLANAGDELLRFV